MIRGLLSKRNSLRTQSASSLSSMYESDVKKQHRISDADEIYSMVNSLLSIATMRVMKNEAMQKNVSSGVPKGYSAKLTSPVPLLNKISIFNKIFGGYEFKKDGEKASYSDFMLEKYKEQLGGE